jgi:predicted metalloendopeptidase
MKRLHTLFTLSLLLGGCVSPEIAPPKEPVALSVQEVRRSGVDLDAMDRTCKPCDDFWRHVNGRWLDENPIPAAYPRWGPFQMLTRSTRERLRGLLESAAANTSAPDSDVRKMGDLYVSCMDTTAIDARGLTPLEPDFGRIAAVRSRADLVSALIAFQRSGRPFGAVNGAVVGPFRVTSRLDAKNPDRIVAHIVERDAAARSGTSIFSLPDRDYYLKEDVASRATRDAFVAHATRLLELAGLPHADAERDARSVLIFETALAQSVMTVADRRNPEKTYHLMDVDQLRALAPAFDWVRMLQELELPASAPINVSEPELLTRMNEQLEAAPLSDWKVWLRWRVLKLAAPYLASAIAAEDFRFDQTVLAGVAEPPPRWETCVRVVDRDLRDALGQVYVEKYFPASAKARMATLVENLRGAMREELKTSSWLQPETKRHAMDKLNALRVEIGYPSTWQNYAAVPITRSSYFENVRAAWISGQRRELQKIGRPVDRAEWAMSPPTVNAYSPREMVKVVFPAGILQPPFFDPEADDAANYGAIGATIGHEIGHQFDDGGSKFDATGRLNNWWTDEDRRAFESRTACIVDQFNTLDVGGGLHHNGKQVLDEALGDLSGLRIAYQAYRRSLARKSEPPAIAGFTADQRFFIAFARMWGTQYREEAKRLQISSYNHPLAQFRAIGTLQNMPEFQRAFGCK